MFNIPDILLETTICDICHKLLSAGPVKVYRNRRTKCGRCSEDNDGGVVSLYRLLAEQGVFKCVNRFDGCRQQLRYNQVADHETTCHSKTHVCPVCPETTKIPTFMLIEHFRERHQDCLLETPSFREELATQCSKSYLYRVNDSLFFIEFKNTSVDAISLNANFLGDQKCAEKVTQKFIVYFGDNSGKYETETKTCAVDTEGFILKKPEKPSKFLFVAFHVDMENSVAVEAKKTIIGYPRTISLGALSDPRISLSSNSTTLLVQNSEQDRFEIVMYCINCYGIGWNTDTFVEVKPKIYQFMCNTCNRMLTEVRVTLKEFYRGSWHDKKMLTEVRITPLEDICSESLYNIEASCIWQSWGCIESNSVASTVFEHEVNCPHQPLQLCPVPYCSYEGKLFDFETHFSKLHPVDNVYLSPTTEIRSILIWALGSVSISGRTSAS